MVDLDILIWLALAALVAGWVDAVAGGGGLLQVPALLLGLPGPGVQALGTNKVASVFGTAAATGTYLRKVRPDMRAALPMTVLAFIGSLIGAATASSLPEDVFRPVIIALLVAAWIWVAVSPAMGSARPLAFRRSTSCGHRGGRRRAHRLLRRTARARNRVLLADRARRPAGLLVLSASVTAKIVNLGTNVAAIIVFRPRWLHLVAGGFGDGGLQRGGCGDRRPHGATPGKRLRSRGVLGDRRRVDRAVDRRLVSRAVAVTRSRDVRWCFRRFVRYVGKA